MASAPCLLGFEGHFRFYQNRTFDFIESGLSDLSEMLGQDRATIHLRLDGERPRAIALQSPFKVQSHPTRPTPGFQRPPLYKVALSLKEAQTTFHSLPHTPHARLRHPTLLR